MRPLPAPGRAEVRHDRGHHEILLEPLARGQVAAGDRQRVVAVADLPGVVDGDEPVAVAVEGEATDAPLARIFFWSFSGWSAPASALMLMPSGRAPIVTTRAPSRRNTRGATRNVAPWAQSSATVSLPRSSGKQPHREVDVVGLGAVVVDELADLRAARAGCLVLLADPPLDLGLPGVGELGSLRREELDAVVLERVMGGAQHDAAVRVEPAREHRDAGVGRTPTA